MILFFISFISANTLFHAHVTDTSAVSTADSITHTAASYEDTINHDEGMGHRQNARGDLLEEHPNEISIWQQIMGLLFLMLHSFFNFMTGEY